MRLGALLLFVAASLVAMPAGNAVADPCGRETEPIFDGGGYVYDFVEPGREDYGALHEGGSNGPGDIPPGPVQTVNAWVDWGDVYVFASGSELTTLPKPEDKYAGPRDACTFAFGGQEILYPVVPLHGLEVQHRWYVDPGPLHGARVLNVVHNPGALPISAILVQGDPDARHLLGSSTETTPRATSDGTGAFSPASFWGVTTDEQIPLAGGRPQEQPVPALAHVWGGPGGAIKPSRVALNPSPFGRGTFFWAWDATVPPGGTVAFISYEIQAAVPSRDRAAEVAAAVAQAEARQKQSPASLYVGMSAAEIAATMNWAHPSPTAAIAPVRAANAARPVRLDGSASLAATGLPQCAVSDYAWQADDGARATGATPELFFAPGKHTATLTVTSNCGGTATANTSFSVASGLQRAKVKLNPKAGTARLSVKALGAGKLTLSGRGVRRQAKKLKGAGEASLTLKPTGKALKALRRDGRAKVRVTASLLPAGGKVSKLSKTVVLRSIAK